MAKNVSLLSKNELLARAEKFVFSTGINDGASHLSKSNTKYGLAQMHLILEKYGFEPKAAFISSPDETISRNIYRWSSGFGYGGRINWGDGTNKIIFLNTKPNQCGILAGGLEVPPKPRDIIKKISHLHEENLYYDDILLNLDYGVSNHFIDCFKVKKTLDNDLPPYCFMIHGSAPEFRTDKYGLGMYIDKSKILRARAIKEETIFGTQYILLDNDATEYLELNNKVLDFSDKKRRLIAEHIFGKDYKVICSQPHQFLYDYNNIYLGCNCTDIRAPQIEHDVFPIALQADAPAFLYQGKANFSDSVLKKLDFFERANDLEILDLLRNANILPHGAGYSFPDIKSIKTVLEVKKKRFFVCTMVQNPHATKIFENTKNLQYIYRGKEIIKKVNQLDLGKYITKLNPIYSLKF